MQPQYTRAQVKALTDTGLAAELVAWAEAREHVSLDRETLGKEPLDTLLLREAAARLNQQYE